MYTAIMATRPSEPFIDSALKSVSVQTMQPFRTIVVVNAQGTECAQLTQHRFGVDALAVAILDHCCQRASRHGAHGFDQGLSI